MIEQKRTLDYFRIAFVGDKACGDHYQVEWQYAGSPPKNFCLPDDVTESEFQSALDRSHGKGAVIVKKSPGNSLVQVCPVEVTITPTPATIVSGYPFVINADPPTYPNARDCEHGSLRRSCERCEDAAQIAELEAELLEQARVNGMGGSREAALMARMAELEGEVIRLCEYVSGDAYCPCCGDGGPTHGDGCQHMDERMDAARVAMYGHDGRGR